MADNILINVIETEEVVDVDILEGQKGESAYQIAVINGFVGTEEEWLESLIGPQGSPAQNPNWTVSTGEPGTDVQISGTYPNQNLQIPRGNPGATGPQGPQGTEIELRTTPTHIQWRYVGDPDWINLVTLSDLEGPQGPAGANGREIELRSNGTHIQYRYVGDANWINIIDVADLVGPQGDPGADGREIELRTTPTHIQWRYTTGGTWTDLVALSAITGPAGTNGTNGTNGIDGREIEIQNNGTHIQWRYVGAVSWTNLVALSAITGPTGPPGPAGIGITSGIVEIDFGSVPTTEGSVTVIGQTGILSTSTIDAVINGRTTDNNGITDHEYASIALRLSITDIVAGVGFTIKAYCIIGLVSGKFKINWRYSP